MARGEALRPEQVILARVPVSPPAISGKPPACRQRGEGEIPAAILKKTCPLLASGDVSARVPPVCVPSAFQQSIAQHFCPRCGAGLDLLRTTHAPGSQIASLGVAEPMGSCPLPRLLSLQGPHGPAAHARSRPRRVEGLPSLPSWNTCRARSLEFLHGAL